MTFGYKNFITVAILALFTGMMPAAAPSTTKGVATNGSAHISAADSAFNAAIKDFFSKVTFDYPAPASSAQQSSDTAASITSGMPQYLREDILKLIKDNPMALLEIPKISPTPITALMVAAHYGNITFAKEIIAKVPEIFYAALYIMQKTKDGFTAFDIARKRGHTNFVSYLEQEHKALTESEGPQVTVTHVTVTRIAAPAVVPLQTKPKPSAADKKAKKSAQLAAQREKESAAATAKAELRRKALQERQERNRLANIARKERAAAENAAKEVINKLIASATATTNAQSTKKANKKAAQDAQRKKSQDALQKSKEDQAASLSDNEPETMTVMAPPPSSVVYAPVTGHYVPAPVTPKPKAKTDQTKTATAKQQKSDKKATPPSPSAAFASTQQRAHALPAAPAQLTADQAYAAAKKAAEAALGANNNGTGIAPIAPPAAPSVKPVSDLNGIIEQLLKNEITFAAAQTRIQDHYDDARHTLFMVACERNNIQLFGKCLNKKPSNQEYLNQKNKHNKSALDHALQNGNTAIAQALVNVLKVQASPEQLQQINGRSATKKSSASKGMQAPVPVPAAPATAQTSAATSTQAPTYTVPVLSIVSPEDDQPAPVAAPAVSPENDQPSPVATPDAAAAAASAAANGAQPTPDSAPQSPHVQEDDKLVKALEEEFELAQALAESMYSHLERQES